MSVLRSALNPFWASMWEAGRHLFVLAHRTMARLEPRLGKHMPQRILIAALVRGRTVFARGSELETFFDIFEVEHPLRELRDDEHGLHRAQAMNRDGVERNSPRDERRADQLCRWAAPAR